MNIFRAAALLPAAVLVLSVLPAAGHCQVLHIVAAAGDTQSAVLRLDEGALRHVQAGEALADGSPWSLSAIQGERVLLAYAPGHGLQPLQLAGRSGENLDLGALQARLKRTAELRELPSPRISLDPAPPPPAR